jgi:GST-like protein
VTFAGVRTRETAPEQDVTYEPPSVWTFDAERDSGWAGLNRPTAGARYEQELPVGEHSLQLYSLATPNGQKAGIMLEELLELGITDAAYDAHRIRIGKGDQFGSGFVDINPNSKIPALLDLSTSPPTRVFESGSILVYLAEKFGALLASGGPERTETMNWLFWQIGSAPFIGGGFGHFYKFRDEKLEYPINRFALESKRQLDVLNRHLADSPYLAGDRYTIADIATWPWYGRLALGELYDAGAFLDVASYHHVIRWAREIGTRPAVERGRLVNKG